ncbi:MAG: caspase family protein [Deltaproteobacteria bacterium]|nr:caspase family protein [Deltaproteobacteria bacterium]
MKQKSQGRWKTTLTLAFGAFFVLMFAAPGIGMAAQVGPVKVIPQVQPRVQVTAQLSLDAAKKTMITKIYKGKIGKRALYANPTLKQVGTKIASWQNPNHVVVSKPSWFFFVDEQPGANWEHKASYILVDKASGEVKRIPAMSPPVEALELKPLNKKATTEMQLMKASTKLTLAKMKIRPFKLPKREKYAVLICGGWNSGSNYARYWNDLQFIFKTLKQKYGYTDTEIIVLYANGTHSPNGDFDGNGSDDIDYAATKANLTTVFNTVANNISASGKFFFYATNHGGDEDGAHKSNLTLWGENIKDYEFANLAKKVECAEAIYVFEQCFSGGMMDDLLNTQSRPCTKPKVCVMTAARHDEVSWGCDTEGQYDEYVYHWTSAVNGKTPGGANVNADSNGDGKVSMTEAHNYAKSKDSRDEHPVIGSCVSGACDTTLFFEKPGKEDCLSFNPTNVSVVKKNNRWKVVDGSHWLFDFGNNKSEAVTTSKIIKHYGMNQSCYVGRPDPSFKYLLVNGKAPAGATGKEDCIKFNPGNIQVKKINNSWKIVDGSSWLFDFGNNKSEAVETYNIIKKYGFSYSCYVGRPDPSFKYLRK